MSNTKDPELGPRPSRSTGIDEKNSGEPRIAVLPFENASADESLAYFGEGLSAELLICLSRIPGVHLIARSAVFALATENRDVREIHKQLHATCVLRGSVKVEGDKLGVAVELVDASTGDTIWASFYDRLLQDVFEMLDDIAAGVAGSLDLQDEHGRLRTIKSLHSADVEAYDRYLQGREFYYRYSSQGVRDALRLFREAIALDDTYALAYSGAADCFSYLYMYVQSSESNRLEAEKASRRALSLDPQLAEAHASLGLALSLQSRFEESEIAFKKAIELDATLFEARYFYARTCFANGHLEQAIEQFEAARRARPEDYQSPLLMGQIYDSLNQPQRAQTVRQEGVLLAETHLELNPGDARALYMGANGLVATGKTKKGLEWLAEALAVEPDDAMLLYNAGCIYALLGMSDEALDCLEQTVEGGLTQREWYENDSNLDSLRENPRFMALLSAMA